MPRIIFICINRRPSADCLLLYYPRVFASIYER
ncbi:hypothetical protein SAJA_05280 [Salinisphaera japonica YTM-1]|uniref:Uncharacterized protein n=1 Tax=Salinisphaera japonica YTM-1 TaxID=1209778 RepID=A0A423PX14_9GAMM|nr:hypothetical protein SAJA_05280 [Salinisphaera japonica YTM-1]